MKDFGDLNLTQYELGSVDRMVRNCQSMANGPWSMTAEDCIYELIRCARQCVMNAAVPSVVMAQAILESGWFSTHILFGIKARPSDKAAGHAETDPTTEVTDNGVVHETDAFVKYDTFDEYFQSYFDYLKRMKPRSGNYIPMAAGHVLPFDYEGFIHYLEMDPAYSTATPAHGDGYYNSLVSIIRSIGLWAFDHT